MLEQFLVAPSTGKDSSLPFGGCILLFGFCIFESCVGIFWPSMMKMRSQYIPEEARSTIMNFFRIPLNLFVCVVLYNVSVLSLCLIVVVVMQFHISFDTSLRPKTRNEGLIANLVYEVRVYNLKGGCLVRGF